MNVRQPSATTKAVSPSSEIAWPVQSRRKLRLRKACSTRARDGAAAVASMAESYPAAVSETLRVACVQLTSGPDKAANLEKTERLVARAAATGADVVALPEKWNAIGSPEVLHAAAEPLEGGESVAAMADWARRHGITLVGGSISEKREGREKLSNTSLAFGPDGELLGVYRKIHLFDVEVGGHVYRESEAEEPGDEPVVVARRGLADRADGLLRHPLPGAVPDPRARGRGARDRARALHDAYRQGPLARALRARAIENQYYVAAAGTGRRDAAAQARVRALADRRPVGDRARAGARRGDGDRPPSSTVRGCATSARSCRR